MALLQEIAAGCSRGRPGIRFEEELFIIRDRREAIRFSLQLAGEGDTILYLGKGHEVSIVYDDHVLAWDETQVVAEELSTYRKGESHR